MDNRTRIALTVGLVVIFAVGTAWCFHFVVHNQAYLAVRARAGDLPMPGSSLYPDPAETVALAKELDDAGHKAFHAMLELDSSRLVPCVLLFMMSVAYFGWQRTHARRWAVALVVTAVCAALSDWTENRLLLRAFSQEDAMEWARWAAVATTAKWTFLCASLALVVLVLLAAFGSRRDWIKALFIDVPYLIDSASRRFDFHLHQEYDYDCNAGQLMPRWFWKKPSFWFFVIIVGFLSYGPTPDGLCSLFAAEAGWFLGIGGVLLLVIVLPAALYWFRNGIRDRMRRRANRADAKALAATERRPMVWAAMVACAVVLFSPVWAAGVAMLLSAKGDPCSNVALSGISVWRLLVCVTAIFAFALACSKIRNNSWLLLVQAAIVTVLASLHWFWLAGTNATEASSLPYRHIFTVLIPVMCLVLCLAPAIARWRLGRVRDTMRAYYTARLTQVELFNRDRADPTLFPGDIVHAMVQSTLYRPLQLLLPPSLLALVAPADWLDLLVVVGFVGSLFLLTWGRISTRWQQLVIQIERWLMSGLAFVVSVFVIAIGILRVLGIQYVSTILDAAPFGAVFGVVLISYVLSWLVEYWINRTAAAELLGMLGATDGGISTPYQPAAQYDPKITVDLQGRYLMSHGIGRILVLGRLGAGPAPGPAFHTYNLLGVFTALTGQNRRRWLLQIVRSTTRYFYVMNLLVILLVLGFVFTYLAWGGAESAQAVVEASARSERDGYLKDLAASLIATDDNARPAVVVAASGGGTRAALYTAHVLQGLHSIGVDRDIVLLSGVSGGAVALTYFSLNYNSLIDKNVEPKAWDEFRHKVSEQFIQDVIEGAAEWRIFGTTPLTSLLAESFERRLLPAGSTFAQNKGPALILNTAIVGHPIEDSEILLKALNPPTAGHGGTPKDCREQQRPYNEMGGGRLIFTNLKQIAAFPSNTGAAPNPKNEIPDVGLPYRIIRDPSVSLARAAALSANFPPAFQNAKVVVRQVQEDADCPDRVYFVTDGGAEENLGLVSALFALQSALQQIKAEQRQRKTAQEQIKTRRKHSESRIHLRPINIVLAEASAAAFDYEQDRGIAAAVGGAKERMTGGLTNALIENIRRLQIEIGGQDKAPKLLKLHYLPLPLVFRARGGFGTHWMQADRIEMSDPRLRAAPALWERIVTSATHASVALSKTELCEVWTDLHSPDGGFCQHERKYTGSSSDEVRRWVCGARNDKQRPRDIHVDVWQSLVRDLNTGVQQAPGYSCVRTCE